MFADPLSITIPIIRRQKRALSTLVFQTRMLARVVSYTERGDGIRRMTARLATRNERRQYDEAN